MKTTQKTKAKKSSTIGRRILAGAIKNGFIPDSRVDERDTIAALNKCCLARHIKPKQRAEYGYLTLSEALSILRRTLCCR